MYYISDPLFPESCFFERHSTMGGVEAFVIRTGQTTSIKVDLPSMRQRHNYDFSSSFLSQAYFYPNAKLECAMSKLGWASEGEEADMPSHGKGLLDHMFGSHLGYDLNHDSFVVRQLQPTYSNRPESLATR